MRAFPFDIDGTLVDSSVSIERVWRQVAREFDVDEAEILLKCHGRRDIDMAQEFFAPESRDAVLARVNILDTAFVNGAVPVRGAKQLLATLDHRFWAAVTSGPRLLMTARLQTAGLPVPQVLITGDDVRYGKPHPEGFFLAAKALGMSPTSCVLVEDSPPGVAAGKAAGALVVALTTTHSADALTAADIIVSDLSELPGIIPEHDVS
ncbi:MAG: HAD-IA family hydrolase [Acidimicrobiales bacterium]